ncbi:MCE family protein [Mycobacterium barrassiae]|uniref:MlaD family protein n=1 Tax=Mycobacterium barrassiae TaxID=319709 RepID=UPI00226586DD|nr:MlaD family protein [Mycobacterium barrassiae]MCV7298620.1 MCE family protein [Mycobacterium barrassiae]
MRLVRVFLSFGVFAAIIVFGIAYIAALGIRIAPPSNRIDLSMQVPDINGLVVDSRVLLRGVPVGKVTHIDANVDHATVDFYVEGDHKVPVDTFVRLENLSALGETYIALFPQNSVGPMLQSGQRIATEVIQQPPSISELATSVVRVLQQMDPGQLKQIVGEADAALPDPDVVLVNLRRTSVLLRNATSDMNGRGQLTLANMQTLLENADWLGPTLASLVPDLRLLGPRLHHMYDVAMDLVRDNNPHNLQLLQTFLGRIQTFLDDRAPDLKVITEALLPKMSGIAGSLMNFDSGRILSSMLAAVPEDGAITLHVTIPPP